MRIAQRLSPRAQSIAVAHPYAWSLFIIAAATAMLWLIQKHIDAENIALFYLVAVLLCAVTAGRTPAVFGAVASFLAFKFFFVEPIYSFTIDNIIDPWQLLSFIAAALITGAITLIARQQAAVAQQQAREMASLYELSQSISAELDFKRIAPLIVDTAQQLLGSSACQLLLTRADGALEILVARGDWPQHTPFVVAVLRTGEQILGELRVASQPLRPLLDQNQQQLLETLANQAALALERSRLHQTAARVEALAESDRLKSTLLSAVSHDLRTPLTSIIAAADELMAEDVQWTRGSIQDFAQIIKREATHLYHLVINLLDLTRMEAGVLRPQRGFYNLAEIIYRVLQRLGPSLEDRTIDIQVRDDLPLIAVDYVQLEQVLWNLLQNALTYTPPRSPLLIEVTQQGSSMELCVGDRGPGIPMQERTRVFEKFYRLSQAQPGGLHSAGLGLAICKGVVEAHGGEITVLDRTGGGTLVRIRLPIDVEANEPDLRPLAQAS